MLKVCISYDTGGGRRGDLRTVRVDDDVRRVSLCRRSRLVFFVPDEGNLR